jgi:hypothetical protein
LQDRPRSADQKSGDLRLKNALAPERLWDSFSSSNENEASADGAFIWQIDQCTDQFE